MRNVKIYGDKDFGLCGSCKNAHCLEFRAGSKQVHCKMLPENRNIIHDFVRDCSKFLPKEHPEIYEMEETAWIIKVKGGKVVGFAPPESRDE